MLIQTEAFLIGNWRSVQLIKGEIVLQCIQVVDEIVTRSPNSIREFTK